MKPLEQILHSGHVCSVDFWQVCPGGHTLAGGRQACPLHLLDRLRVYGQQTVAGKTTVKTRITIVIASTSAKMFICHKNNKKENKLESRLQIQIIVDIVGDIFFLFLLMVLYFFYFRFLRIIAEESVGGTRAEGTEAGTKAEDGANTGAEEIEALGTVAEGTVARFVQWRNLRDAP
jgi:hypothetical protein